MLRFEVLFKVAVVVVDIVRFVVFDAARGVDWSIFENAALNGL